jgi:hypothetical protein
MSELTYQEKEKLFNWLMSQKIWHAKKQGKWHKSQSRYYAKKARFVFTFTEIMQRAIQRNRTQLLENISKNNALFQRLKSVK